MTGKCAAKILFSTHSPQYAAKNIDPKQPITAKPSPLGHLQAFQPEPPAAGLVFPGLHYSYKKVWSK